MQRRVKNANSGDFRNATGQRLALVETSDLRIETTNLRVRNCDSALVSGNVNSFPRGPVRDTTLQHGEHSGIGEARDDCDVLVQPIHPPRLPTKREISINESSQFCNISSRSSID